jgi:predicted nucleic acid-binding protein
MNLVDTCGWLEYLTDGKNADFFAPALEDPSNLLVPAVCIYEVFKIVLQRRGEKAALQDTVTMQRSRVIDLDPELAIAAAKLSADLSLPMADAMILATARAHNAVIWTQDTHFKGMEGVRLPAQS